MSGRLLSVNVGGPREVEWQGKTVRTAIWKAPVDGPRMVRRINIDGDDQADRLAHGGEHRAVFVYQLDSYRYWERELGRDDFTHGQFGENFTVEGLADDEVCIGDRYRIGEALFEVTQPRVTCYRVGIRMDEPAMPSLLVSHHRPGFYLRVLEEGAVQAGDEIVKVADGPERVTVADVDALLYLPGKSRTLLERALRVPALSEGWKGSFRELLAKDGAAAAPAWAGFRPLRVAEVRRESATITSFRLVPTDDAPTPTAGAGQYLTVRLRPDPDGPPLIRSYSLSDLPGERGYRISVKREGTGEPLPARPRGRRRRARRRPRRAASFVLRAGTRPVVLISAGVGATPVLAMLHALAGEQSARPVWWLHGARNRDEHAFGAEVDALLSALPGARRLVAYSRPPATPAPTTVGRLDPRLDAPSVPTTPTSTSAAPTRSCGRSVRRWSRAASRLSASPPRPSAPSPAYASGIVKAGDRAPHAPEGDAGTGPPSPSHAATSTCPGATIREPARLRRGLRRPRRLRLPQRRLPQLRERPARRRVTYDIEPLEPPPEGRLLMCCTRPSSEITLDL